MLRPMAAMVLSTVFHAGDYRSSAEGRKGEIPAKCMQGQNFLECKRLYKREDGFFITIFLRYPHESVMLFSPK